MSDMNGSAAHPPETDTGAAAKARAVLDAQIRQIIGTVVRGILVSAPGVPAHEVLNSISRVTGALVSEAVIADLAGHFQLRKGFKDAFHDGVKAAPMQQPGAQPPPQNVAQRLMNGAS